jgi:hypothetical protein
MIGETDYPCIFDDRPGVGRTYVQMPEAPRDGGAMQAWLTALRERASYFGDGRSHVFDLAIDGNQERRQDRSQPGSVQVTATLAALIPEERPEPLVDGFSYDDPAHGWDLEWARVPETRLVPVELILNGQVVAVQEITADGSEQEVAFDVEVTQSSWVALRILPSVHTQPVFVTIADAPIRASRRSAEWLRECVDKLWDVKNGFIRPGERDAARVAYDRAREIYLQRISESTSD